MDLVPAEPAVAQWLVTKCLWEPFFEPKIEMSVCAVAHRWVRGTARGLKSRIFGAEGASKEKAHLERTNPPVAETLRCGKAQVGGFPDGVAEVR